METPIKMDDLGVPPFKETPTYRGYIPSYPFRPFLGAPQLHS